MKAKIIDRRHFLRLSSCAAAALGVGPLLLKGEAFAAGVSGSKPAVIWLEGQDCAGCTESVLASLNPAPIDVLLDTINLQYHETIMSGSGEVAETALQSAINKGGYVLVLEGSIPNADKRFLKVGGVPVEDTFVSAAQNAVAVVAVGACATYGGIPKTAIPQGRGADHFLTKHNINKTLINLPGCPLHPAWFYDTVVNFLSGNSIQLDKHKRPVKFFGTKVHCECPKSDSSDCLEDAGCKGKMTFASCASLKWNDGVNWCVGSNAPCAGCTEPRFYDGFSPLYQYQSD